MDYHSKKKKKKKLDAAKTKKNTFTFEQCIVLKKSQICLGNSKFPWLFLKTSQVELFLIYFVLSLF